MSKYAHVMAFAEKAERLEGDKAGRSGDLKVRRRGVTKAWRLRSYKVMKPGRWKTGRHRWLFLEDFMKCVLFVKGAQYAELL